MNWLRKRVRWTGGSLTAMALAVGLTAGTPQKSQALIFEAAALLIGGGAIVVAAVADSIDPTDAPQCPTAPPPGGCGGITGRVCMLPTTPGTTCLPATSPALCTCR